MSRRQAGSVSVGTLLAAAFVQCTMAGVARAQSAPAPAATATATVGGTVAPPVAEPAPAPAVTVTAEAPTLPPPPASTVPTRAPPLPDAASSAGEKVAHMDQPPPPKPVISSSFGVRVGVALHDPAEPKSMSELHMDTAYVEARFHGDLNDNFGWVANFNASAIGYTFGTSSPVQPMDLIVKYHACDAFNVWAGRLLVPSDRSNFAGPFFMSPWNYPGFYGGTFIGPKTGPNGRDQGATLWGEALESKFKYFVGAYGIDQSSQPYYSARLSYAIQGSEPGYFGSSTYFGDKSVVAIGVGGQYQKSASDQNPVPPATNGAQGTRDTTSIMADILAEEAVAAGTFSLEGQVYAFNTGERVGGTPTAPLYSPKEAFYVLASYLTPENVGVGKLQPLVRLQQTSDPGWTVVDVQLGYIMKAYFLKLIANYQHTDANGFVGNALQFGAQAQM